MLSNSILLLLLSFRAKTVPSRRLILHYRAAIAEQSYGSHNDTLVSDSISIQSAIDSCACQAVNCNRCIFTVDIILVNAVVDMLYTVTEV